MKKVLAVMLCVVLAAAMLSACSEAPTQSETATTDVETSPAATQETTEASASETAESSDLTFGYLAMNLADEWNQYSCEAFKWAAVKDGVNVEVLDCQTNEELQVSQAQSFIDKGVDAISIYPCSPEIGAMVVSMCNDAGIPIAIENIFLPDDNAGDVVGQVACQYGDIGYAAVKYMAEKWPDCKMLYCHGGEGVGVYESYKVGVDQALTEYADSIEMVGLINGEWETEAAYNVTVDFINSDTSDFGVIFANNDMEATGCYNAVVDSGLKNIPIISTGGSLSGYQMVKDGTVTANMTAPVSIQGIVLYKFLYNAATGVEIKTPKVSLPVIPVDLDNIDDWIMWDNYEAAMDYINANLDI